jgi:tRNA threonylcarbamoyladenosine biosynthesis protein TsaE
VAGAESDTKVSPVRTLETSAPQETEAVGAELAAELRPGDVVLVRGEVGAGKTTLVRGAARALGVVDPVTSPTFGIGHRYRAAETTVAHLDLYRLAGLERESPGLLDDYLEPQSVAFVEWPQEGAPELAGARMVVTLLHLGGDRRRIEVCEVPERREHGVGRRGSGVKRHAGEIAGPSTLDSREPSR